MTNLFPSPVETAPAANAIAASLSAALPGSAYLGPALVLEIRDSDRLALVQWQRDGQPCLSWARPTLSAAARIQPGYLALVLSQNLEDFYLLDLLAAAAGTLPSPPAQWHTPSGASVTVGRPAGAESIQIRSQQGALMLEFHPESGKTTVNVASGDLEFVTRQGNIVFQSSQTISFVAHRLETKAETVVSETSNVYSKVEELTQLQTGRLRVLVQGNCHLKARDAFLKAEQDFKVEGEQIHLG